MITGDIRNTIDQIWYAFWTLGIANPPVVIKQIQLVKFDEPALVETVVTGLPSRADPSMWHWTPSSKGRRGGFHAPNSRARTDGLLLRPNAGGTNDGTRPLVLIPVRFAGEATTTTSLENTSPDRAAAREP